MNLTERDLDLIQTLTMRVPMLMVQHVAEVWWPAAVNLHTVNRRIAQLSKAGWIERHIVNAYPSPPGLRPLFSWQPGGDNPDVDRLAQQLPRRWPQQTRPTEVVVATPRTASLLGSAARGLPPLDRRHHDLRVGAVYVHYRRTCPELAGRWVGRDARPKAGEGLKDPDAVLQLGPGSIRCVIQIAGNWEATQVVNFHDYCVASNLPYQLW